MQTNNRLSFFRRFLRIISPPRAFSGLPLTAPEGRSLPAHFRPAPAYRFQQPLLGLHPHSTFAHLIPNMPPHSIFKRPFSACTRTLPLRSPFLFAALCFHARPHFRHCILVIPHCPQAANPTDACQTLRKRIAMLPQQSPPQAHSPPHILVSYANGIIRSTSSRNTPQAHIR